ncbi:MAG: DUF4097 family beta strand repeat-containing protein [Ktedonobacteraceae bacterium]
MNEQEMQFANPDWQPSAQLAAQAHAIPQPDNALQHERLAEEHKLDERGASYKQGYQGQQHPAAHHQMPSYQDKIAVQSRTRRPLWPWLVVIVALICLVPVLLGAMAMVAGQDQASVKESHAFVKGNHAFEGENHAFNTGRSGSQIVMHSYGYDMAHTSTVKIDDPSGSIHVHGGVPGTQSQIQALSDSSVSDPLQFSQGSDGTLTIKVNPPTDGNPVLLDIALPQNIALNLGTSSGNIEIDGIHGQVNLQADRSITMNNDTISGQSNISSTQGDVRIVNSSLSGKYVVTGNNGSIALQQVNLSGQGQIQAQTEASIMMVGLLDPQGNYTFTSTSGEIDLALPSDTAIQLHIDPGTGSSTSDFSTQTGRGAPTTVKTDSGNIQIRQGP